MLIDQLWPKMDYTNQTNTDRTTYPDSGNTAFWWWPSFLTLKILRPLGITWPWVPHPYIVPTPGHPPAELIELQIRVIGPQLPPKDSQKELIYSSLSHMSPRRPTSMKYHFIRFWEFVRWWQHLCGTWEVSWHRVVWLRIGGDAPRFVFCAFKSECP